MNKQGKDMIKAVKLWEKNHSFHGKYAARFHLMPKSGWLNDPNGLGKLGDRVHIYFQYAPFGVEPGLNFWGHYSTKNFVEYQYHTPALCCDTPDDCHGVYSGSSYIEDGKSYLYYTGNVLHSGAYDYIFSGREHNTILVETDGETVGEKQVLLRNSDYPEDVSCHVRDPKVFYAEGRYYMVLGARRRDDVGEVLLYQSENKKDWALCQRITTTKRLGYMWECPDLFSLGGRWVLMFSPQGVEPDGYRFQNMYQTGYAFLEGDLDGKLQIGSFEEIDRGFDFYAPQSFLDTDGRRIQIGWMAVPDSVYQNAEVQDGWHHILTLPCVLKRQGDKIYRYPIEEIEKLRGLRRKVHLDGRTAVENLEVFDCEIRVREEKAFTITIKQDAMITYQQGVFSLSFGKSGLGRERRSAAIEKVESLRILCDTSSLEIFINGGEESFSSRFYPEEICGALILEGLTGMAEIWPMKSFVISEDER